MRPGHLISVVLGVVFGFAITHLIRHADHAKDAEQADASAERMAQPRISAGENEPGQEPGEKVDGGSAYQPPTDAAGFEAYLEKYGYSKEAMIAVALLSRDVAHLIEAAERYPDDPHIQLLVIGNRDFPGDKTEWYRRFKESQPDNLLASLLLGSHLLNQGSVKEALAQLRTGGGQSRYSDFTTEGALAMESALIELGHSPFDAKLKSSTGSSIGYAVLLQKGLIDLNKLVESASGDAEKLELATLGVAIGNQLSEGEANRSNVNRLFGLTMEKDSSNSSIQICGRRVFRRHRPR